MTGKHRGEPIEETEPTVYDMAEVLRGEMAAAVSDIEWRLAQHYELKRREQTGVMEKVYAEDTNFTRHMLTGYTLTSGTPANGITWASLHIVYQGVDYSIVDGNMASPNKYATFIKPLPRNATITTTSGSAAITAGAGTFDTVLDVGASISGTGIPAGATIASVTSATAATLSVNATASGSPSATINRVVAALTVGSTVPAGLTINDTLVFTNIPFGVGAVPDSGVTYATGAGTITDAEVSTTANINGAKLGSGYNAAGLTGTAPVGAIPNGMPATKLNVASHFLM